MKDRFSKGSGKFECKCCGKMTRDTGDNGSVQMCPLCFEKSSCGNSLSDNGWGTHADLDNCKTAEEVQQKFEALRAAAESPKAIATIDVTPTWAGLLPTLLAVHENAMTVDAKRTAFAELRRMAELADAYAAEHSPEKTEAVARCEGCGGSGEVQVDTAPNGSWIMAPCSICRAADKGTGQ